MTYTTKKCPKCGGALTAEIQRYGEGWHDCPACGWRETSPTELEDFEPDTDEDGNLADFDYFAGSAA